METVLFLFSLSHHAGTCVCYLTVQCLYLATLNCVLNKYTPTAIVVCFHYGRLKISSIACTLFATE